MRRQPRRSGARRETGDCSAAADAAHPSLPIWLPRGTGPQDNLERIHKMARRTRVGLCSKVERKGQVHDLIGQTT